jgi:hypothetical protein
VKTPVARAQQALESQEDVKAWQRDAKRAVPLRRAGKRRWPLR